MAVFLSLLFFIGLFIGSFLLVIIDRLPKQRNPFTGRSKCDHCNHTLAWYDLLPLLSYAVTKGTCRYCYVHLSRYYPFVEVLTGFLFALTGFVFMANLTQLVTISLMFALFTVSVFIIIFFTDLKYGIIPFAVVIPACIVTILMVGITNPASLLTHILSALGAFFVFFLLFYFTKGRGMGFGDVVLVFYLGLLLGFPGIGISLYLAFLTGAAVSLILIALGRKKLKGGTVPFGPFLIIAALVSYFWAAPLQQLLFSSFMR